MSTVTIDRPPNLGDSEPFWPLGRTKVFVTITVDGDNAIATGADDQNNTLFTAAIRADQQTAFLEAVKVGTPGSLIDSGAPATPSNDNRIANGGAGTNHVIVTDGPGPGGGPRKFYDVTLPLALGAAKRPTGT